MAEDQDKMSDHQIDTQKDETKDNKDELTNTDAHTGFVRKSTDELSSVTVATNARSRNANIGMLSLESVDHRMQWISRGVCVRHCTKVPPPALHTSLQLRHAIAASTQARTGALVSHHPAW